MNTESNMPEVQLANSIGSSSTTEERRQGRRELQRLKSRLFAPETKPERIARALAALQAATKPSLLDAATLRHIALHGDFEGF